MDADELAKRDLLRDFIEPAGELHSMGRPFILWRPGEQQQRTALLDGDFTADELEAIAWWMRSHAVERPDP